jgi:hypothetical protein
LTTETPNPTPDDGGASTLDVLDRIEQKLNGAESGSDDGQSESDDQSAESDVKPDGDGDKQATEPQLTTSDLAKLLKLDDGALDLDEEGNAVFKTKVDGVEGAAKLQDLLKSYQLQEHVDKKSREASEREKALEKRTQEVEAQFAHRLQYAERLNNIAGQQLLHEFQSIDWRALEAQDPGTAALWRQKFQERHGQLQQVDVAIRQEKAQAEQKTQAEKAERERKEAEKLPLLIPEWKDASVAHKEKAEITAWAQKAGLQPEEMEVLTSTARNVQLLRKAMLSDRLALQKVETEKRVRTAPTLVKPGTTADDGKAKTLKDLKDTVRKTGGKKGSIEAYLIAKGIA